MPKHTPATLRIQRRLERLELETLRAQVEELLEDNERLQREARDADDRADMWHRAFQDSMDQMGDEAPAIGLTQAGEIVVGVQVQ